MRRANARRGNYATGAEKSQGQFPPRPARLPAHGPVAGCAVGALPRGGAARPARRRHLRRLGGSRRAQAPPGALQPLSRRRAPGALVHPRRLAHGARRRRVSRAARSRGSRRRGSTPAAGTPSRRVWATSRWGTTTRRGTPRSASASRPSRASTAPGRGGSTTSRCPPTCTARSRLALAAQALAREEERVVLPALCPLRSLSGATWRRRSRLVRPAASGLPERQIFCIDHYMTKETVQNILVLRFAQRDLPAALQTACTSTTCASPLPPEPPVGHRHGDFEGTGVLCDTFQTHLMQLVGSAPRDLPPPSRFTSGRWCSAQSELVPRAQAAGAGARRPPPRRRHSGWALVDDAPAPGYLEEHGIQLGAPLRRCTCCCGSSSTPALAGGAVRPELGQEPAPQSRRASTPSSSRCRTRMFPRPCDALRGQPAYHRYSA